MWDKKWLIRSGGLLVLLGFVMPTMTVSCSGLTGVGRSFSLYDLASLGNAPLLYLVPLGALAIVILAFLPHLSDKADQSVFWGQIAGGAAGILSLLITLTSLRNQVGQVGFEISPEIGALVLAAGYILVFWGLAVQWPQVRSGRLGSPGWQWPASQPVERGAPDWSPPRSPPLVKPPYLEETLPPFPDDSQPYSQENLQPVPPAVKATGSLQLLEGSLPVSSIILSHDDFTIGRGSGNDLLLEDRTVSRKHARLRYAQGAWYIQDLQSAAGLLVNGEVVAARRLEPGDEITIGSYRFEYRD
jgi:pSer/pThr/pTyr-binding forkhead associated (FHA) protein